MDCELPDAEALAALAMEVASWPGDTYIHCANGHGRSASLAALVMVLRGEVPDTAAAFVAMKAKRAQVKIQMQQVPCVAGVVPVGCAVPLPCG